MRAMLVFLVACSSTPPTISSDVSSRDMRIGASIVADETGSPLVAYVDGPHGFVALVEGDRLVARQGTNDSPLAKLAADREYGLDLGPVGGEIDVVLLRPHDTPIQTSMFLPPPFVVHAPASASRAAPLTITWDASSGPYSVALSVSGTCLAGSTRTLSLDAGTYTINAGELAQPSATATCTATVTMVRSSPLGTSYPSATQTRHATFESTP